MRQLTSAFVSFRWRVDDDDGWDGFNSLVVVIVQSVSFTSAGQHGGIFSARFDGD